MNYCTNYLIRRDGSLGRAAFKPALGPPKDVAGNLFDCRAIASSAREGIVTGYYFERGLSIEVGNAHWERLRESSELFC